MSVQPSAGLARGGPTADLTQGFGGGIPQFVNTTEAARILNVSASFLHKARLTGNGPEFVKFGFHVRYSVQALLDWASTRTRRSTSEYAVA